MIRNPWVRNIGFPMWIPFETRGHTLPQVVHLNGFALLWMAMWRLRLPLWLKFLPHWSHCAQAPQSENLHIIRINMHQYSKKTAPRLHCKKRS